MICYGQVIRAIFDVEEVLVLLDELGDLSVGSYSRQTAERFGEVGVERRSKEIVESFQFPSTVECRSDQLWSPMKWMKKTYLSR